MSRGMIEAWIIWGGKQQPLLHCCGLLNAASLSDISAGDSAVGVEADRGDGNRAENRERALVISVTFE